MALGRCLVPAVVGGVLWAATLGAQASTGTVEGRIIDGPTQAPLPGVNVVIEGTQLGAVTREGGEFSIRGVPAGSQTLRAFRIGYTPQTQAINVTAGATTNANFTMQPQAIVLEGLVVTGYGTQRREAITGSVATIQADEANVGVVTNANDLIQGRVAGVQITTNNGEPGAGVQVRIRGGTSISASNEPLYVIDGVPISNQSTEPGGLDVGGASPSLPRSPLNLINPNDIASITILKDASATAIYGSRAANGVVLIETKKGPAQGGSTLEYDGYVSQSTPSEYLDLLTGSEYRAFIQDQVDAGVLNPSRLDQLGDADTDWEREVTRNAMTQNHNVSFAGGRQDTRYRASLNYMDQEGVVLSSGLERIQGRLNASHNAFDDRLRLGLNLTASHLRNDYVPFENTGGFEGTLFTNAAIFNPTQPVRTIDPATGQPDYFEIVGQTSVRNPVAIAEEIDDRGTTTRALGNIQAELDLIGGLVGQINLGADRSESVRKWYLPASNPIGAQFNGLARQVDRNVTSQTLQTLLTYRGQLFEQHGIDMVGGYEFSEYRTEEFGAEGRSFITDLFRFNNLGGGSTLVRPFSWREDSRLVSFFGRANYNFNERFYVTGVLRYDGASQFGSGEKWALFPAVSASYRLADVGLLPEWLSEVKLRAGWGLQGNAAVRPYQSLILLGPASPYVFGGSRVTGVTQIQNANPNLKWEETEQYNVAVDYGILNNRFSGTIEYYIKNTEDLLLEVTVPQPAIVSTRLENIGKVRNSGLEASLDALVITRPDLTWQAGFVFAAERNEVRDLGGRAFIATGGISGQGQSGQNSQRIIPGEPLGTFFGRRFVGVNAQGKQLFACKSTSPGCVNGQTTDPTADDFEILGNANPDWTLGLRSQLTWNKFDASVLIRTEVGQEVFNNGALVYSTKGNALQDKNFYKAALDDPTGIREPAIFSSRWVEDGSFIRLQNLTVGYTIDVPMAGSVRPARIYGSIDNLFLITDYTGYDPEVHTDAGLASRGIDYLSYPRPRTFTLGARVSF